LYTTVETLRIHGRIIPLSSNTAIYSLKIAPFSNHRYPGDSYLMAALTSPFKLAVITMKPLPQIVFRVSWAQLAKGEDSPCKRVEQAELCWWIPPRNALGTGHFYKGKHEHLFLAFSFGCHIGILRISWLTEENKTKKLSFEIIAQNKLPERLLSLNWLNSTFIVAITESQKAVIFNSLTLGEVERSRVPDTGAGILQSLFSRHSLSSRVCVYMNRIFLLLGKQVWFGGLIKWRDRIENLIQASRYEYAFKFGIELFNGNYIAAVSGLPRDSKEREDAVSEQLAGLLLNYCSMTLSEVDLGNQLDKEKASKMCSLILTTCSLIQRHDLMFDQIWERFEDCGYSTIFLQVLKDLIIRHDIQFLPNPTIVREMFQVIDKNTMEEVFLSLDPKTVDLHHSLKFCRSKRMFKALIHVYNNGMNDYTSPAIEILHILQELQGGSNGEVDDIYTFFVYIAYTMTGKKFPVGFLEKEIGEAASKAIFRLVFAPKFVSYTTLDSRNELLVIGTEPWPYLYFLCKLDLVEMLHVIGEIFQNEMLESGISLDSDNPGESLRITHQYILNVLLHLENSQDWQDWQIDQINSFVGRCIYNYSRFLSLTRTQVMRLFNSLVNSKCSETKSIRQTALVMIYNSEFELFRGEPDRPSYIKNFADHELWQIYRIFVISDKSFELAIRSYLNSGESKAEIFPNIRLWVTQDDSCSDSIKETLKQIACELDSVFEALIDIISTFWPQFHTEILEAICNDEKQQYRYLSILFKNQPQMLPLQANWFAIFKLYIAQLALYDKGNILEFLKFSEASKLIKRIISDIELLELVSLFGSLDLEAERIWTLVELKQFEQAVKAGFEFISKMVKNSVTKSSVYDLERYVSEFCVLANEIAMHFPSIWIDILDNICFNNDLKLPIFGQTKEIALQGVIKNMAIPDILSRLLEKKENSNLKDERILILDFLELITNQIQLSQIAAEMTRESHFGLFRQVTNKKRSSCFPSVGQCQICKRLLHVRAMSVSEKKNRIIIFDCHHAFHEDCLMNKYKSKWDQMGLPGDIDDYEYW
jgi:hypothetical protein